MTFAPGVRSLIAGCFVLLLGQGLRADPRVSVVSSARADYTARKFGGAHPLRENYVFMRGSYFEGGTVDHSIERTTFPRIAEYVATHLVRQNYFPTRDAKMADLAIVIHWGTTLPYVTTQEMSGRTSAVSDHSRTMGGMAADIQGGMGRSFGGEADAGANLITRLAEMGAGLPNDADALLDSDRMSLAIDQLGARLNQASNVQLLGYGEALREASQAIFGSPAEQSLRLDLTTERYFIILKAYELHPTTPPPPGQRRRAVWTVHLNVRSPGMNFGEALARMSAVAPEFSGRTSERVRTVNRPMRQGAVDLGELINLGEAK